jgi:hypothetical protein
MEGESLAANCQLPDFQNALCCPVDAEGTPEGSGTAIGLCGRCIYARRIESAKRSVFYLCELSTTNPQFPRYPRLPVLLCAGYQEVSSRIERF